jgi:hypothetical protein
VLVPVFLGLCAANLDSATRRQPADHGRSRVAVLVSAMRIAAGGFLTLLAYRCLGLKLVSRSWFNLDATWALSLILMGCLSFSIGSVNLS